MKSIYDPLSSGIKSDTSSPTDLSLSNTDYELSADGLILVKWNNGEQKELDMNLDARLREVKIIGEGAFRGRSSLTSVTISSSVTSIESGAFRDCDSLTSITLPRSVTSIGWSAFYGCSGLEWIVFDGDYPPESPEISDVFREILGSVKFIVPKGAKDAYIDAGYPADMIISNDSCKKENSVGEDISSYDYELSDDDDDDFTLVSWKNKKIKNLDLNLDARLSEVEIIASKAFCGCDSLTSITLPSSVRSIGRSAFSGCSSLTLVCLPSSVRSIGRFAFSDCSSLTSIAIPSSVTSIGESAFYGCESLTCIDIPGFVMGIEPEVFRDCRSLTSITISSSVTSIGRSAFENCSSLTSIIIPSFVRSIGEYAFSDCSSLTSIDIPSSVRSIGGRAFCGCSRLTSVIIPSSVTSIRRFAFSGCSSLTRITIPSSVTSIEGSAFSYCRSLTSIVIPNSVTRIESGAFSGCSSLTKITIPSSVTRIESGAFSDCSRLISVVFDGDCPPKGPEVSDVFLMTTESMRFIVPKGAESAYIDAGYPADMIISNDYKGDEIISPYDSFKKEYVVWDKISPDDYKLSADGRTLVKWENRSIKNLDMDSDVRLRKVEIISKDAFVYLRDYLERIHIPSTVTSIERGAFSGCSRLMNIDIPSYTTSIGCDAFRDCSRLTRITIPSSVTSIGGGGFLWL